MKNLSRIFLKIGGILSIITGAIFAIVAIVFIILATPASTDFLLEGLKNGTVHTDMQGTPEQAVVAIQIMFLSMAICFGVAMVFEGLTAYFVLKAAKKETEGAYITAIVFGFLSGTQLPLVGAIFGLIASNKEQRKEPNPAIE